MNFFQVLKKIGSVALGIEHVAVPIISIAEPQFAPVLQKLDGWLNRTANAVVAVEATITDAKSGGLKQDAVIKDFENGLETAQAALAIVGKTIKYDVNQYKQVIDDFTKAYNDAAAFKKTWDVVDLPKDTSSPT